MPYTPPSQRSPATSKPNSPILSRNHSYADQFPLSQVGPNRPALPRSVSSTSYLNKQHRRSSSVTTTANNTAANGALPVSSSASHGPSVNGSIRQSPTPVNHLLIPSGAITTPPDSSDDDEEQRGRSIGNLKELHEALQNIHIAPVERGHSPVRKGTTETSTKPVEAPKPAAVRSLSAEARKIAHSRSSSDMNLSKHNVDLSSENVFSSSDGSDAEDDELRIKPPLLRKKSGELVKPALRPASRRRPSSMPGTPTYAKAVHFNEDIEQVRHFLQVDRPIAVSAGSSPVETYDSEAEYPFGYDDGYRSTVPEFDIKLANFPSETFERKTLPVRVERIFMSSDHKTLVGTVAVANIAFQKLVVARFTLDYWKTTSEVVCEYNHDIRKKQLNDGYDRFNFNIKLSDQANLASKTLLLCVRYQVDGQEFWDNNNSMNYQVDFIKKAKQPKQRKSKGNGAGFLNAIPRSRHSPPAPRPKSMPVGSFDDDFGHGFDSKFEFGANAGSIGDSPSSSIRLKPKNKRGSLFPDQATRRNPTGQAFSSRYDFGASLTAALSTAQSALGDRSGIKQTATRRPTGYFDNSTAATLPPVPGTRQAANPSSDKPGLQSAEYNELIQKFCFFGTPTGKGSPQASTPVVQNSHTDGASDYILNSNSSTPQSSASNSPPSPVMPVSMDGANDLRSLSRSPNHFLSRSASPGPVTGSTPEDHMTSHQFQYGFGKHGGIFPESNHAPQACV
ncbi:carbohydrate-binding module family 21 protein [Aaosphaeria arxii CBS 175.79]|uniref:Carbohydrate-binding module family 21 protein n=1 Tax=Aaosphaeria arxii CBS 175.79 TaxID=1450172 RepID=A0A6A5XR68_9PLEO|nr:carbohydrate-binding module family 21 protein [Aaosphaeria arxii CBS 175.79]KAF2015399.1 carbohydrate-binding module family 21 protein [Aaosphaeria arxii CBS 175.79]